MHMIIKTKKNVLKYILAHPVLAGCPELSSQLGHTRPGRSSKLLAIFPFEENSTTTTTKNGHSPARPKAWANIGGALFDLFSLSHFGGHTERSKNIENLKKNIGKTPSLPPSVWPACEIARSEEEFIKY